MAYRGVTASIESSVDKHRISTGARRVWRKTKKKENGQSVGGIEGDDDDMVKTSDAKGGRVMKAEARYGDACLLITCAMRAIARRARARISS